MSEKFLKVRVPEALYQALLAHAGAEGKRLGTHIRERLEREALSITITEVLTRIESAIATSASIATPAQAVVHDHQSRRDLMEVRLLVRELAMQSNAQILPRVAAQLAAQTSQSKQ